MKTTLGYCNVTWRSFFSQTVCGFNYLGIPYYLQKPALCFWISSLRAGKRLHCSLWLNWHPRSYWLDARFPVFWDCLLNWGTKPQSELTTHDWTELTIIIKKTWHRPEEHFLGLRLGTKKTGGSCPVVNRNQGLSEIWSSLVVQVVTTEEPPAL